MKKAVVLAIALTSTAFAGEDVITQNRPQYVDHNSLNLTAQSAAMQFINIQTRNTFISPGIPYITFDPQVIVTQPSPGVFCVQGAFYSPLYKMSVSTDDGGKVLGAIAGALIGKAADRKGSTTTGALVGLSVGTIIDNSSAQLNVSGVSLYFARLSYTHSQDSCEFISLWTCDSISICSVEESQMKEAEEKAVSNMTALDELANEYWIKALDLQAQANSLRTKTRSK